MDESDVEILDLDKAIRLVTEWIELEKGKRKICFWKLYKSIGMHLIGWVKTRKERRF
jgi:hypothetical protein